MKCKTLPVRILVGALICAVVGGCAPSARALIHGTAFFREPVALPPDAVLEVSVEDVSRADAPAKVVGSVRLENLGDSPFEFEIPFDPSVIDQRHTYSVRATIRVDDTLMYATDASDPVLTHGAGTEVELLLHPIDRETGDSDLLGALPASFEGLLPCADCPGIDEVLDLFDDGVFYLRMRYRERGDAAFDDIGTWWVDPQGETLALRGNAEAPTLLRIVDADTLRLLDSNGKDIESSLSYDLHRSEEFVAIEPKLTMRGMYAYLADAGLFSECLTGRTMPVALEEDNAALERAYLKARTEPGESLLVTIEGRIAMRPPMEGDGLRPTVVVEKFKAITPGGSCTTSLNPTAPQR